MKHLSLGHVLLPLGAILSLTPWLSSGTALLLGVALALAVGNPYLTLTKRYTTLLLQIAVVGLGAGMNLIVVGKVGAQGIVGIFLALILGTAIGRLFRVGENTSILISVGTAICGGSAIAAVSPVLRAKSNEVSVALGTVFLLNAVALLIFPPIGHHFTLSETQFGLWCALAIHDTSSVVGASLQYGAHAMEVATTVKLARALWIVPVAFAIGLLRSKKDTNSHAAGKAKRPWFILGFLLAAALVTYVPALGPIGHEVEWAAKKIMVLTLFLIGASLTRDTLRAVGIRPFFQGLLLWILMAAGSLGAILGGWVA
jgi:uncharacterized integral membrane protein (TIGR00698 family)